MWKLIRGQAKAHVIKCILHFGSSISVVTSLADSALLNLESNRHEQQGHFERLHLPNLLQRRSPVFNFSEAGYLSLATLAIWGPDNSLL